MAALDGFYCVGDRRHGMDAVPLGLVVLVHDTTIHLHSVVQYPRNRLLRGAGETEQIGSSSCVFLGSDK